MSSGPEEQLKWRLRSKMREAAIEWYRKKGLEPPKELFDDPKPMR